MALHFKTDDYHWTLQEGLPTAGSSERSDPTFIESLNQQCPSLTKLTMHELASWIVARLNYLTSGALEVEGKSFANDTDEFGYNLRLASHADATLARGGVMIQANRVYFASIDYDVPDFQSIFVNLLAERPGDLAKCEIVVHVPESKKKRRYGWDGYSLINR